MRVAGLADLARQLRFESEGAARRQLVRVEGLLLELMESQAQGEMQAAYPEEWVVFRITGMRRDTPGSGKGDDQPASVVREALLGDLAGLIERLSSRAKLGAEELDNVGSGEAARGGRGKGVKSTGVGVGGWLGATELAAKWGVSRKTVERACRGGLAGRRVTLGKGRERVVFGAGMVAAYERAFGRPEERGGGGDPKPRRMSKVERAQVLEKARTTREDSGWSLDRCAVALAKELGRSRETIRQVLQAEERRTGRRVFAKKAPSRATTHRAGLERRLTYLSRLTLGAPVGPMFDREEAAELLLGNAMVRMALGRVQGEGPSSLGDIVKLSEVHEAPDARRERALAGGFLFLLYRARRTLDELAKKHAKLAERIDRVETDLRWASRLKAELVREQLPGALRAAESVIGVALKDVFARDGGRSAGGTAAVAGVVRVVIESLGDAVDRFDPFKGGRLAGAASLGVSRAVAVWEKSHRSEIAARVDGAKDGAAVGRVKATPRASAAARAEEAWGDWTRHVNAWQEALEPGGGVQERAGGLDERSRRVLERRYGWDGTNPRTAEEVAAELKSSAGRVRAWERRALEELGTKGNGA